jgi:diguanylate cyclase (GGDEF)-like protein
MKYFRIFIMISAVILSVCFALSAIGLAVLDPGGSWEKKLISFFLAALSPLTLIGAVLLLKALTAFASKTEQFTTRDPLTNLYNQPTFWDFLGYEIERAKRQGYRFTIMLIDLDNFKTINDLYGHETGDAHLKEFSMILKQAIRKGDIPARYGGDDFAAILPVCDESQACIAGQRLLDSLREHHFLLPDGSPVQITASIGMSVFPDHASDAQSLFLLAETVLHQSKSSGKDRLNIPHDKVNINLLKNAGETSIFIMDAIMKKKVVPYFQPIVNARDRSIMAYEVLTRIVTTDKVIPAAEFIEVAETMGVIGKIDLLLIEQAFDAVKRNRFAGKLFINLSPKALLLNEFIPHVRRHLVASGLEPSQLVFEITERETVKNLDQIGQILRGLQQEGFQIAIDDFGAGYSSFQYLKLFKADYLKVDGEFIRNLSDNSGLEHVIVASISQLAKYLKIKTIAEFVESGDILEIVCSADINYAQGYHVGRPLPDMIR